MSHQMNYDTLAIELGQVALQRDTYRDMCEELKTRLIAARFMFAVYGITLQQLGDQINETITKAETILGEKQ
jgi:hypothetical protein